MDTHTESRVEHEAVYGDWHVVERVIDTVQAAGLELRRVGLTARRGDGAMVTGSAAAIEADPFERARFELLERAALMDAVRDGAPRPVHRSDGRRTGMAALEEVFPASDTPAVSRVSLSNGAAVGPNIQWAISRSRLELVERDRLLRAWYGELAPVPIEFPAPTPASAPYAWRAVTVPADPEPEHVVAVFGLPRDPSAPLVRGFAARMSLASACAAAMSEAIQSLAFLWGEELPSSAPAPTPTPMFHLDHYLWPGSHACLADWLDRGHGRFAPRPARCQKATVRYFDLTPESVRNGLRVVRAVHPGAARLVFGEDPRAAHLPPELRVHPIS